LDDGLFDVVWSEEVNQAEVIRLIPAALWGTLLKHPKVHLARARGVRVELTEEVPAHVDGEILEPTRVFRARVLPGALRVLAPCDSGQAHRAAAEKLLRDY
jgi:diacylglycerol kinase family enzyme